MSTVCQVIYMFYFTFQNYPKKFYYLHLTDENPILEKIQNFP